MNWHLEGSVDKTNWIILDRRIYLSLQGTSDPEVEEE